MNPCCIFVPAVKLVYIEISSSLLQAEEPNLGGLQKFLKLFGTCGGSVYLLKIAVHFSGNYSCKSRLSCTGRSKKYGRVKGSVFLQNYKAENRDTENAPVQKIFSRFCGLILVESGIILSPLERSYKRHPPPLYLLYR